jgi:predicted dehydrogenase
MAGDGLPRIAVVGAGIFARTQYIPRLREIAHLVLLKTIWSRTKVSHTQIIHRTPLSCRSLDLTIPLQESAEAAAELARDFAPEIQPRWGDAGLEEIMGDASISAVAVVLAGQVQVRGPPTIHSPWIHIHFACCLHFIATLRVSYA